MTDRKSSRQLCDDARHVQVHVREKFEANVDNSFNPCPQNLILTIVVTQFTQDEFDTTYEDLTEWIVRIDTLTLVRPAKNRGV